MRPDVHFAKGERFEQAQAKLYQICLGCYN